MHGSFADCHRNTHDSNHVAGQDALVASAVVYPSTVDEVQAVVRWANETLIPIHPISMGRNLGYGGAAPRVSGSVVVDLGRRMNKVLKVDGQNASCLLEAGVSYFALYEAVQRSGLSLWIDCPDLGGGSVMGNALDRGVGYTPYGDHFGMHCGMEVVLPDGSLLRTGMGALPGEGDTDNLTWQSFQHAYGPAIEGVFSQSNYGIVTKMGFWLMPATSHQTYMVTFPRDDDFEQIVDLIRPLAASRVFGNVPQLRHVVQELAVTGRPRSHFWPEGPEGSGRLSESNAGRRMPRSVIAREAARLPCGDASWIFYGCQYGDEATIHTQLELIKSTFAKVAGSKFLLPSDLPPRPLHPRPGQGELRGARAEGTRLAQLVAQRGSHRLQSDPTHDGKTRAYHDGHCRTPLRQVGLRLVQHAVCGGPRDALHRGDRL
jgi:hypothetical protein